MTEISARSLRTEDQIVLACSVGNMQPAAIARVRESLAGNVNWKHLIARAHQHAVLPLVNRNLQLHFRDLLPEAAANLLAGTSWECMRRNMTLTAELFRILGLLGESGIEVIPFKGPTLAVAAYGDLSLRMFADLDILVGEQDLDAALKTLLADGYKLEYALTPKQGRIYRKTECALQLRHTGRNSVVELHWLLTERYLSIDMQIAGLWQRRTRTFIGQRAVMSLSPEDLFLYVCVHGSKHRWERLEWLCLVAAVANSNPDMNWRAVAERATNGGTERILHLALLLARNLLGMPLPEQLCAAIESDNVATHLAEETSANLFSAEPIPHHEVNRGEWYLYLVRIRERWQDKLRILVYSSLRLPHPDSREIVHLPSKLDFLYYILRPARLIGATVWAAMHHTGERHKGIQNTRVDAVAESPVASILSR